MKRKIMILFVSLLCALHIDAQTQPKSTENRTLFTAKTETFTKHLSTRGYDEQCKTLWNDVHALMIDEFAVVKRRIADATVAGEESEKTKFEELFEKQMVVYEKIIEARNLSFNQLFYLQSQLNEFALLIV